MDQGDARCVTCSDAMAESITQFFRHGHCTDKAATFKQILSAPLPRAYIETEKGTVAPADAKELLVGQGINADGVGKAMADMKTRLQMEVLGPMEKWLEAYKAAKVKPTNSGYFSMQIKRLHLKFLTGQE